MRLSSVLRNLPSRNSGERRTRSSRAPVTRPPSDASQSVERRARIAAAAMMATNRPKHPRRFDFTYTLWRMRFCLVAMFLASSAMGQECPIAGSHMFYGATLRPGADSAKLASKLARTADYNKHAGGWLAKRLFALDDDVEITGEIAKGTGCIGHADDDDL